MKTDTKISHDEARAIAQRFIDGHFGNRGERPRASIPADPSRDDDIRLVAYIYQQRDVEAELARARGEAEAAMKAMEAMGRQHAEERARLMTDASREVEATWVRVTGYDDPEVLDLVLGRAGIETHLRVLTDLINARPFISRAMAAACIEEWDARCTVDGVHDGSNALPEWAPIVAALRAHASPEKGGAR